MTKPIAGTGATQALAQGLVTPGSFTGRAGLGLEPCGGSWLVGTACGRCHVCIIERSKMKELHKEQLSALT